MILYVIWQHYKTPGSPVKDETKILKRCILIISQVYLELSIANILYFEFCDITYFNSAIFMKNSLYSSSISRKPS